MQRIFYICLAFSKNHSCFASYCFTRGVRFIPCNTHIGEQQLKKGLNMPPLENFPQTSQSNQNSQDSAPQNSIPDQSLSDFGLFDHSHFDEPPSAHLNQVGTSTLPGSDSPSTFLPVGSSPPYLGISITPSLVSLNTGLTELGRSVDLSIESSSVTTQHPLRFKKFI